MHCLNNDISLNYLTLFTVATNLRTQDDSFILQYENSEKFDPVAKWKSLSPSGKLVYSIIACNIAVFIAWRLNPNAAWMHRYMVAEITGK